MVAEPLLTNAPGYAYGVLLITIVGCWVMRRIKSRWPNISNLRLILATYAICFVFDFVMEALVMLPIGFYTYPGAIRAVSFNAGTYYQWPIYEGLMWGGVQAALCCLRFFTDDRGRTIVERGLDNVRGGVVRQQFIRFLAIFAGCQHLLLRLLQRARAMDRHAFRPLAGGPHEALVLHRRHLRRRNRHALPRPGSSDSDQALRLHQQRRRTRTSRGCRGAA